MNTNFESIPIALSIIIPAYNVSDYIANCLNSLVPQLDNRVQTIIVDNNSSDNTLNKIELFKDKIPNMLVLSCPNQGTVASRCLGLEHACGKYIAFIDADDWAEVNYVSTIIDIIKKNYDCVMFDYKISFSQNEQLTNLTHEELPIKKAAYSNVESYNYQQIQTFLMPYTFFSTNTKFVFQAPWNKVFKKQILDKYICRDNTVLRFDDLAFTYECMFNCKSLYYYQQPLYIYNKVNPNSLSVDLYNNWLPAILYSKSRLGDTPLIKQIDSCFIRLLATDLKSKILKGWCNQDVIEYLIDPANRFIETLGSIDVDNMLNNKMGLIYKLLISKKYLSLINLIRLTCIESPKV